VGAATAFSKLSGLLRQQLIAAAFGLGVVYEAYNYAYILPGFFLILLGGINGPFHSAVVSTLARRTRAEGAHVIAAVNTIVGVCLIGVALVIVLAADPLIRILGPGLTEEIHTSSVIQLRWMAPITSLAGLVGIGYGALNAADEYWLPAVSPLVSNISVIGAVALLYWKLGPSTGSSQQAALGGAVLAGATLLGAILQWLIQLTALSRQGLGSIRLVWDWRHSGVNELLQVMGPATLASGMLQINVVTDLLFASDIFGAAAGMSYAGLVVLTPVGILSTSILTPFLPALSRLTAPHARPEFTKLIGQTMMLCVFIAIPVAATFFVLARPIIVLLYQRGAFDSDATSMVSDLLMASSIGIPAYLSRDVIVRVFYALSDGQTPFRLSTAGIGINALLDWMLVGAPTPWGQQLPFINLGATGLVLATVITNLMICFGLLLALNRTVKGIQHWELSRNSLLLLLASALGGITAWWISVSINWPLSLQWQLIRLTVSACLGLVVYVLVAKSLRACKLYDKDNDYCINRG
jgi:putative peptidoglycan lipid II flippase